MARTILDPDLNRWEVFASTGPSGFAAPSRIVFRCVSDRSLRSRAAEFAGDHTEAEAWVERADPHHILPLLEEGVELS